MLGAAPVGFGVVRAGRIGRPVEGGQVGGRAGVADRVALVIEGSLGEQAGELDLAGVRPAIVALAGAALGLCRDHGHPGAVDREIEHVGQRRWRRERDHLAGADRVRPDGDGRGGCGAVSFGGAALSAWQSAGCRPAPASRRPALANGTAAAARAVILASPGDIEAPATPSSASRGAIP